MIFYRDIPVSRWLVATLLIAAAQFIVAPTSAQARCGDYVIHGGDVSHATPMASESDRSPSQPAAAQNPIDPNPQNANLTYGAPRHRSGCPGPNCSNDHPRPFDEPKVPVETDVRHFGLIAMPWQLSAVEPRFARFADEEIIPRFATGDHYRPPR
jgi:hypothetical protein